MMNGNNGGMGGMGGNIFGNFIFTFILIIIILLIIAVLVWMFKPSNKNNSDRFNNNESLDILKQRLARGEISEEEYERLKNKLK
ncbi:CcoQ/FixQ family Cbb3-type cytochrome c oxidase assembly chaperone [Filobacillus milosensis]|uniref:CcoQ/FixQ family Cbb3-type cytochrome c oxidase assembly chaperone n=1 Tax=Filobacillus milosensis TaxID=94137 RepID=A0A4Y8IV10_9BACI|nr:SHOCT domain-containing protein [Filobacillus milosensis]TFB25009.1 CcoQ/FixQ family Cbb3-type cytochrome c oxidase assembly chaperone [Filobacillus milosensis]